MSSFLGLNVGLLLLDFVTIAALYLTISLSLNLEFGYAGIPNFGKVLFVAAGASVAGGVAGRLGVFLMGLKVPGGFLSKNATVAPQLTTYLQHDIPASLIVFITVVVLAVLVGGGLGFFASLPAIRLREDYLAMLLFVLSVFAQVFLVNYNPLAGGANGVALPDPYAWSGDSYYASAVIMVATAFLVFVLISKIESSPSGRLLRAIRDNHVAAEALGKDVTHIRRNVLVIASAIAAAAGALYTLYTLAFNPYSFDSLTWTFWPFLIIILGGLGNVRGTLVGTVLFWAMLKGVDLSKTFFQAYLPFDVVWLNYLLPGAIIILVIFLRPEGIVKEKPGTMKPLGSSEDGV